MAANIASASQWAALCKKYGLKDPGVQKALARYEGLGNDKHAERVSSLDEVVKHAGALKQSKEGKANAEAGKAIDAVVASAQAASKVQGAAAAKAKEAEKQRPDPAKIKALVTALRQVVKLPAGAAAAKGVRDVPCSAEKERADRAALVAGAALVAAPAAMAVAGPLGTATWFVPLTAAVLALNAFIDATDAWLQCLKARKLDLATDVDRRLKHARDLRDRLQRECDQIQRWVRMFPSL